MKIPLAASRAELFKILQTVVNLIVLDTQEKLDCYGIVSVLQKSLDTRQERHTEIEPIYANIDVINKAFDALEPITNMDVESDRLIDRATKLEHVKIDISRIKVMA